MNDAATNNLTGLSSKEVELLTRSGKSNRLPDHSSQSVSSIICRNVFTYFNGIFFGLAILVICVGAYRNLTFLPVVIANMIIGIVQQLRAKKVLDALSLLDVTEYTAIRDGKEQTVAMEKLVEGDLIRLTAGQQIPADAEVVQGSISANEALLTGEADEIEKEPGSELMSGSFVVSGSCVARLTRVGAESYAAKLTTKAKEVKNKKSEMIRDIELIILIAGIVIIPVGAGMVYNSCVVNGRSIQDGVVGMVGAVVGMIPEGLYLLLTVALTMSAARLARKKVLLHDMKSIETLARVDVLCVDKTGTITSDVMTVTGFFAPEGKSEATLEEAKQILASYACTVPDTNITMEAIRGYFHVGEQVDTTGQQADTTDQGAAAAQQATASQPTSAGSTPASAGSTPDSAGKLPATSITPFSSKLKYSEIKTADTVFRFGAPEFLLTEEELIQNKENIESYTGRGQRVLALVKQADGTTPRNAAQTAAENSDKEPTSELSDFTPILFIALANEIRDTAPDTFSYFAEQGVKVKVISGDNPLTVSRVAMAAKIEDAEQYVDAATLKEEEDYREAVQKYTVFGRVKPEQKKLLIEAIKANGQKVAMTGDGVNDILAMKEADCSIAMGGGSDAARQAAQVVLMDSDFSHMKQIVSEGRRIINNMTRSGILFLYKNIFSLLLALLTIVLSYQYPMRPTQISLISGFNIGLPGFLLAMENNTRRQHGRLLTRTLTGAAPAAILSFILVSTVMIFGGELGLTEDETGVAATYMLSAICFMLLWRLIHPLNRYRIIVFLLCVAAMIIGIFVLWDIFILAKVSTAGGWKAIGLAAGSAFLMWLPGLIPDRRNARTNHENHKNSAEKPAVK